MFKIKLYQLIQDFQQIFTATLYTQTPGHIWLRARVGRCHRLKTKNNPAGSRPEQLKLRNKLHVNQNTRK